MYLTIFSFLCKQEICVVRFTPVTEEDQISYALLFAYFSSRKRYGVAANNMKQVKDLYLIPLGSSDKVPHHLVPFDGPGKYSLHYDDEVPNSFLKKFSTEI